MNRYNINIKNMSQNNAHSGGLKERKMINSTVIVTKVAGGSDEKHRSSGVRFFISDGTKFKGLYVRPEYRGELNRLYFKLSTCSRGKGNFIKAIDAQPWNSESTAIKFQKMSRDTKLIENLSKFEGKHELKLDAVRGMYYITRDLIDDENSNAGNMLLNAEHTGYISNARRKALAKKASLSDKIEAELHKSGMSDKVTSSCEPAISEIPNRYQGKVYESDVNPTLGQLTAKDLSDIVYRAAYSAQTHSVDNIERSFKLQCEQMLTDIDNLYDNYVYKGEIFIKREDVVNIIQNVIENLHK